MPVQTRMDRDGARHAHADMMLNDYVMTEAEELDWEAAKQGAHSRRWGMLASMTKAEQRAYRPLRK